MGRRPSSPGTLTPYRRIMEAAKAGRGIRLTAEEVWELSRDDAIERRARLDEEGDEELRHGDRGVGRG